MDNRDHIYACKEMLEEKAYKAGLKVWITDQQDKKDGPVFTNITVATKHGFPIYKAYSNVSQALGFIDGYKYSNDLIR